MRHPLSALILLLGLVIALSTQPRDASATLVTFNAGTLIIPMDTGTNGQNNGMLRAYGLVYALLRDGVPVQWVINPAKGANGDDFAISVTNALQDVRTGATLAPRSYRGGPFLIAAADAATALPLVQAWQAVAGDQTAVHRLVSASSITVDVARTLVGAPRIAILQDGNETIAFNDLNAAGIPDSTGASWDSSSPDLLTETEVAGPTASDHGDGILFQPASGLPRYCHFASMHYNTTSDTPEVVQEVRAWLSGNDPVHAFMQCEAARVFENAPGGLYLTTAGIDDDGSATTSPAIRVPSNPLDQLDGTFEVDSGSVDSMAATAGSFYKTGVTTLINESTSPLTSRIVMLTGRLDGDNANGAVTYLAGHDYATDLPISSNPQTNGVRLFLNSIFESGCATSFIQDDVTLTKSAPAFTNASQITYTIDYTNPGPYPVENVRLTDRLPAGTTFVSATGGGTAASGVVTWELAPLAAGAHGSQSVIVGVATDGTYTNRATMDFSHLTVRTVSSVPAVTVRDTVPPTVTIVAGPTGDTNTNTPTFRFTMGSGASAVCAIDDVNYTACSPDPAQYTTSPLSQGSHIFTVRATDAAGNSAIATRSFNVDSEPPIVDFADPPINQHVTINPTPSFYFTAFDDGPITTFCSVAGDPYAVCTSPFTTRTLPDGTYEVSVFGRDGAGNTGPTDTFAFTIDHLPPIVSIPVPPNQTTVSTKTPTFTFADVGPPGTTVTFMCRVDSGVAAVCVSGFAVPASPVLSDGSHTLTVTATDEAGNTGQASLGFTIDTVAPLVVIPGAPTNPTDVSSSTPTLFFQTSNTPATTPIVSATCKVFDAAPPNALRAASPANAICDTLFSIPSADALTDGSYLFEVTAIDAAGNIGRATHSFSFTVDTSAPVVTILVPPSPTDTNNRTPSFTFSVEPGGTPVTTTCRVYVPFTTPPAGEPCSSPYTVPNALADGTYIVEVIARDSAGNVGSASLLFHIDNEPPAITITGGPPNPTNNRTPQFTFTISSTSATTTLCRVDLGSFGACASPFTVMPDVTDGDHTFTVQATDAAGNQAQASRQFTVDTTPPIVGFSPGNPTVTNVVTPTFSFTVTDVHPVASLTVCVLTDLTHHIQIESRTPCPSPYTPPALVEGIYTLDVFATDAAGNQGHNAQSFTIDTTPPTVTITSGPPEPTNDTTPTFGFTTGGTPVSTRCRIDGTTANDVDCSGSFTSPVAIGNGPHTFYVTVTDAAGNSATASHAFTVDTVAPETVLGTGEPARTNHTTGTFSFSSEPGTTFQCRIDQGPFVACSGSSQLVGAQQVGSHTTGTLLEGFHTFEVRAIDAAGNVDPTPASETWFVDLTPPVATFAMKPPDPSNNPNPQFIFASEPGATFECHLDADIFVACPATYTVGPNPLTSTTHTMYVRATDPVGNAQVTPTTYTWTVDLDPPDTTITRLGATPSEAVVSFVLTSNEAATFECNLDNTGFAACASTFTTPALSDGQHTLVVRAIDTAGNVDPTPAVHPWIVAAPTPTPAPTSNGASLCDGGPFLCKAAGATTLTIRNDANDNLDKFSFSWTRGDATTTAELGDPTLETPYAVCVWDTNGGTPRLVMAMDAAAGGNCTGKPCWRSINSGKGVRYKDVGLLPDGIKQLTVRSGTLGKAGAFVKARGIPLPDPPMPFAQDPTITVQVVNGLGSCWGAEYVVTPQENSAAKLLVKEKP
jgi:uncharacterized repeat protein (TIGR01451 family)